MRNLICRSFAIFVRNLPILPAILAPVFLLYLLESLQDGGPELSVHVRAFKSDDSYIQNVLHVINMPSNASIGVNFSTIMNSMDADEVKARLKKISPYIVPRVARIRRGASASEITSFKQYLRDLDIMSIKMPEMLPEFRNPCWREPYHLPLHCEFAHALFPRPVVPQRARILRCLPYFYIIGMPKCGTTDIYRHLGNHPDVVLRDSKEPYWINRRRLSRRCSSLLTYTDFFHNSTRMIEQSRGINTTTYRYHYDLVTGDGSVDLMWDNHAWQDLPRNRHCPEPCFTNADYVRHINPNARIIVALRDPINRVYSDYMFEHLYLKYTPDKLDFHKRVIESIYRFKQCLTHHSTRYCVYDTTLESPISIVRPLIGLYHEHLQDWLRVFPRHQIHVVRFEDYISNTRAEIQRLFHFLHLRRLSEGEMGEAMGRGNTNRRPAQARGEGDMLEGTRMVLRQFYRPYNQKLAQLLGDSRFLWNDETY